MLETIRTAAQTWLAKLVLALITIPFALWGVESYIRTAPGQDIVATVGDQKVTSQEFTQATRNQLEQFRQQFGQIDPSVMDTPEMRKSVLDQLINQRAVSQASKAMGLTVSDLGLRDRISTEPTFQDDGKFSAARYDSFLKSQGMSAPGFEAMLRGELERQHFVDSVANTGIVPTASAQQYLRATEQSREVAIVNITPDQFSSQVKIGPDRAKAFYEEKKADYTIPEQVRAEYVELSVDSLAPSMQVTADEVKKFYETNSARYVQKEERKASHILISVAKDAKDADKKAAKEKADALYAQLKKNPKDFADLAKKNSQDPGSGANGGDLGYFARGAMVKPFEDAVFSAKKDELIAPVLSDFGYHIIRVSDIRPEKSKSIAEATPEIEGELKKQKAQKTFAELAEKFSNQAFEQSASLAAAAAVASLPIKQSGWISKGMGAQPPFTNAKLTAALFSDEVLKNKRNTEAIEVAPNTLVAARVLESKPSTVRPFAEVEAGIVARLTREEAAKLAKKEGEEKLKALQAGKAVDIKFPPLLAVSRANQGGLAPNVIDAALRAGTKSLPAYVGVETPAGPYTLVQVGKVIEPAAADDMKLKSTLQRLQQAVTQQQLQSVVTQIRNSTSISIAKDALEKKTTQ
jgi:peptidyl-prolyl cis-trans isomerase D